MPRGDRQQGQAEHWVPLVVGAVLVVGFVLLLGRFGDEAGGPTALATTTSAPDEATTTTGATTTTTDSVTTTLPAVATTTTTAPPRPTTDVSGSLLDGTPFTIHLERPSIVAPQGIHGVVMLDRSDGTSVAAGILDVTHGRILEPSVGAAAVSLPAGGWTVTLRIYDALQAEVASAFPDTIEAAFSEIRTPGRLPSLRLTPPLRWADDDEVPSVMEVDYGWFSVRRGCPEEALQCSELRAVALISGDDTDAGGDLDHVFVGSPAPRPAGDAWYLDPGPLSPRQRAQVVWTGDEMIVFGGTDRETSGTNNLTDGAAYDPARDSWRTIATYPDELGAVSDTRAVWGDRVMYVVDADGLAVYDPDADAWEMIGLGLASPRQVVWSGGRLWVWTARGLYVATPGDPFEELPPVPFGSWQTWEGLLVAHDEEVFISALSSTVCSGRFLLWPADEGWEREPTPSLATADHADCSLANQIGVIQEQIVIWEGEEHPAAVRVDGSWIELPGPPVRSFEGVGGSLAIGDLLLLPVGTHSAAYDPATMTWIGPFELPAIGPEQLVWTGTELLGWMGSCCESIFSPSTNDAWRWRPPPQLFDK